MTSFINRYSLDVEDQEVLEELSGLRCIVAQLWLDIEPTQARPTTHPWVSSPAV